LMNILNQFGVGAKYRQESGTTMHGFPIHGKIAPNLTQEEYENLPLGLNVQVKVFDLSKLEDLREYASIRDQIANRKCVQLDRTKLVSEDGRNIHIHLEWADVEGYVPKSMQRRF
jgi:hypothetical protein